MRENITVMDTPISIMTKMSEGNPGGMTVLMKIFEADMNAGIMTILGLDDMNIWGSQIWVGYKDHCGENLEKFIECVGERDAEMVKTINSQCPETAVTSGASFKRP